MNYILQTSNFNKLQEYQRFGMTLTMEKGPDRPEVQGTPEEVILYKTLDAGAGYIVEDTALDIEGFNAGVNIRWILESGLLPTEGARATWHVYIGQHTGEFINISHATLTGRLAPSESQGFGFDPYFIPDGYSLSLHDMGPTEKDCISPRKKAIEQLLSSVNIQHIPSASVTPWTGGYQ